LAFDVVQHALERRFPRLSRICELMESNVEEMADLIRSLVERGKTRY
jgi:hypothetical protein